MASSDHEPKRIVPGSLHLFTHPAQQATAPVRAHFSRRYSRPGPFGAALFLFDALSAALVLALAVTLASFVLAPGAAAPVRLSVSASEKQVRAADTVGFVVRYENRGKEPLMDASLALSYPEGFRITALAAETGDVGIDPLVDDRVIALGRLAPGGNGVVRVTGYMLTEGDLRFHAQFTGREGDAVIQSTDHFVLVRVVGSALKLRWAGMPYAATVSDRNPVYVLVADNEGNATVGDISAYVFCLPLYPYDCPSWTGTLLPGESRVIGEHTYLYGKTGPSAGMFSSEGGRNFELATVIADVNTSEVGPRVEITNAFLVGDGKWVEVQARIISSGPALDGGAWRVFPQPWSAVDLAEFPPDPSLEENGLPAGAFTVASDTPTDIAFRIPLKPGADISSLTVRATASACVASTDHCAWSSSERVAVSPPAPTLAAELRYYTEEGEQLGRGPLPPRVGEKTEYWVVVRVEPGLITRDTELLIDLGPNVSYAGKFTASVSGAPRQVGNTLLWRPDTVVDGGAFTFAAALAFRPTADQIDAEAVIVRSVRLLGKDAEAAQTEAATGYLATDVPADPRAAEKGTRVGESLE